MLRGKDNYMHEKLTTSSVQDFLKDYLANSETLILEEGKETDDILEVAEARGYNLKNRNALAGFKTIYTFADAANKNKARLPKEILLKVLPEIIGTPVNIDHIREYVVGHYIDYKYIVAENKIIAYGVFYKANFGAEWKKAQQLFKEGKLGTSYEIWCPKRLRKYLPDGTYELTSMEIAGGALIFKEKPAFEDAKVLEVAKQIIDEAELDLVVACVKQYDKEDLITSATEVNEGAMVCSGPIAQSVLAEKASATLVDAKPLTAQATPALEVIIPKVTCQNCNKEFDNAGFIATQSEKQCPHCKAIVGEHGEVKYPPQVIDFNVSCPSCRSSQWRIIENQDSSAHVQCQGCKKEYNIGFEYQEPSTLLAQMAFVYLGSASCPQCGLSIPFSTVSNIKTKPMTCSHCGLKFHADIAKANSKKKINRIEEIAALHTASAEGGNKEMAQEEVVSDVKNMEVPPAEVVAETPIVPVVEVPVTVVVPEVVAPIEVVAEVPVVAEVVAQEEVPVVPVVEPVLEKAAKQVKSPEEIEQMELDLCKIVAKNKKYKDFFKAACNKIRTLKKSASMNKASVEEIEVVKTENEQLKTKVEFLETSAVKVVERKNMLGDAGKDLSDKDILDDDKFELARAHKENADLKASMNTASAQVAVKVVSARTDSELASTAKSIDDLAFPKTKK